MNAQTQSKLMNGPERAPRDTGFQPVQATKESWDRRLAISDLSNTGLL